MSTKNTDEQLREFYVNQIKTTVEIVKQFSNTSEFSPTMLLNSLLSLDLLPLNLLKITISISLLSPTITRKF